MAERSYRYVIVGSGLAGTSAAQAIRERDQSGSLLLIGAEHHLPYDRPPLSKKLWFGQKTLEQVFLHNRTFYDQNNITLALGARIVGLDPHRRTLTDAMGREYRYGSLLLATGASPRRLSIPGGDIDGVCYFRELDDYVRMRRQTEPGKSAVVIGGGFIGSEMAAALNVNKVDVTMIFPGPYLCHRVFPAALGCALQRSYQERGINVLCADAPVSIDRGKGRFVTRTRAGHEIDSEMIIAGLGVDAETALAKNAGLRISNGVAVDQHLLTSDQSIFAAGDNCSFPYSALSKRARIEHWDNAQNQGRCAGRNMTGGWESYDHLPYFFSDLFDFGYEAVGETDASLETYCDWQKENHTGVIYYLKAGKVRGVMLCNIFERVEAARNLIKKGEKATPQSLRGAIAGPETPQTFELLHH